MKVGSRFRSASTGVEIIVVKAAAADVALTCAGEDMVALTAGPKPGSAPVAPDAATEDMLLLGKRYMDADSGMEFLCTSAGAGPVCIDGRKASLADAKFLPSSD